MPNLEWRHPGGSGDPAWLMSDGAMIGMWYPDGMLMLYMEHIADEPSARHVLEAFARTIATVSGENEYTILKRRVRELAATLVPEEITP